VTPDEYVNKVVDKYHVDTGDNSPIRKTAMAFKGLLNPRRRCRRFALRRPPHHHRKERDERSAGSGVRAIPRDTAVRHATVIRVDWGPSVPHQELMGVDSPSPPSYASIIH